ncbi:hypothetical protein PYW08_012696 [Mythimna loreyi]|uniref:Uncharacterized protein n=1 Tax=Mythimna loreyi TaxID=667449 RepID=A0ACC2Q4I3_9NEOP|nr:hypothetical protein PYW08_012696 [Mythimna loreyi]
MLKITAILTLMFIVSSVWSACDSCGSECASACGTRRFRACCFNYLRRKRGPDAFKMIHTFSPNVKVRHQKSEVPVFMMDNVPMLDQWTTDGFSSENQPYSLEDMFENHLE